MDQLYLVRHGNAEGGPSGMDRDHFLTELGQRQAHALGVHLKSAKVKPQRIYCSIMTRARQTAGILKEHLDAPVVERRDLIEHGTQAYTEDCSLEEAIRRHPERLDAEGKVRCCQGLRDGLNWEFSIGGEDMRTLHARALSTYKSILTEHRNDKGTFIIVAHGSFLSAFLTEALGLPLRPVWNFGFENCGFLKLDIRSNGEEFWPVLAASTP